MPELKPIYRAAYRVLSPVSGWFRARVRRRAVDAREALTRGRTLVIAPHPDDETLGCAGTVVSALAGGHHVHIVVATDGSRSHDPGVIATDELVALRRAELIEAARRLGLTPADVTFLGYRDGALEQQRAALDSLLDEALRVQRPDRVLVTSRWDSHPDHRVCALAAAAAATRSGLPVAVYEYPIWYWERLPWTHRPERGPLAVLRHGFSDPVRELLRPRALRVDVAAQLEAKRHALAAHASQVAPFRGAPPHLAPAFVAHFTTGHEIFFPAPPGRDASTAVARSIETP